MFTDKADKYQRLQSALHGRKKNRHMQHYVEYVLHTVINHHTHFLNKIWR